MPRRRREPRPIPAAAKAHEIAAIKAADLMDKLDDLYEDFRDWGKLPFNFRWSPPGFDIMLPPDELTPRPPG